VNLRAASGFAPQEEHCIMAESGKPRMRSTATGGEVECSFPRPEIASLPSRFGRQWLASGIRTSIHSVAPGAPATGLKRLPFIMETTGTIMDLKSRVREMLKSLPGVKKDALSRLGDEDELSTSGVIDSLGMAQFVGTIEMACELNLEPEDLTPENFQSIGTIARFLEGKQEGKPAETEVSLLHLLNTAVREVPLHPAITDIRTGEQYTYERLLWLSRQFAAALSEHGVGSGHRVMLFTRNQIGFFPLLFACAALKAVLVPINPDWKSSEISVVLADSQARLIVLDGVSEPDLPAGGIERTSLAALLAKGGSREPDTAVTPSEDCEMSLSSLSTPLAPPATARGSSDAGKSLPYGVFNLPLLRHYAR